MGAQQVNPDSESGIAFGPCLHLGKDGERCGRPAREDGFCERHSPASTYSAWGQIVRRAAGAILLLALLWQFLADMLREISRWLK